MGVKYRALALFQKVLGYETGWVVEDDNWIPGAASAVLQQLVREVACSISVTTNSSQNKLEQWDQLAVAVEAHGFGHAQYPIYVLGISLQRCWK